MIIKDEENYFVIELFSNSLCAKDLVRLRHCGAKKPIQKRLGIDLKNVVFITLDFFKMLKFLSKTSEISLFNVSSEIITLLFLTNYNRYVSIYADYEDFRDTKREIVNRRLKICAA